MPMPRASARSAAFWITGPSAIGSENGTPSSMRSAPAVGHRPHDLGRGVGVRVAGGDVGDQRLAAARRAAPRRRACDAAHHACPAGHARGSAVELGARQVGHGADVLVAAARQVDQQVLVGAHRRRQLHRVGHRVARFERRDDALGAAQAVEGGERLVVGDADVFGAADVLQVGVLGADAGVVEAGRDRMRLGDLAVVVLQQVGAVAVQHAGRAADDRRRVLAAVEALRRRPRRRSGASRRASMYG